jgi:retron-type reverse transcriptase
MKSLPLLVSIPEQPESLNFLIEQLNFDNEQTENARNLIQHGLPPLVTPAVLPYLFGVSHKFIGYLIKYPNRVYKTFSIKKSNGGYREIRAPMSYLKIIQQWIYSQICSKFPLHQSATGFVKTRNIFYNGNIHENNGNLLVVDIANFFPTIKLAQVISVFLNFGFPIVVSKQLASLCCFNNSLPQGAPTSPCLANIISKPMDDELFKLSSKWGCHYSRYADDIAFSGKKLFNPEDISEISTIIRKHGFTPNANKIRIIGRGGRQVVAGLVVNQTAKPPRQIRKKWRALFHQVEHHPELFYDKTSLLIGITAFINQYDPTLARKYRTIIPAIQSK